MTASAPAQQYNAVLFNCTSAGPQVRLLAMTLAGIVNRDSARLYLLNCYETWSYTITDETWRDAYASRGNVAFENISSIELLKRANSMLRNDGWSIVNVDSTVNLERPKLAPHITVMRKNIASALGISADSVSVKATSGEGIGVVGTGEGAAA